MPTAEIVTQLFRAARGLDEQAFDVQATACASCTRWRGCFATCGRCRSSSAFAALFALRRPRARRGVVVEFLETGLVPRLPTAVLATGLMLLASLSVVCGMILDNVARGRRETKRLAYLAADRR